MFNTQKDHILKLTREVKTAFLILGCILVFIVVFNYLKGSSFFDNDKIVHTLYDDVEGLVIGANVTINGLNVGKVKMIDFNENYDKIKVTFSIRQDLAFSKNSIAQLYVAGLIGGKAIALLPVYDSKNIVKDGDILNSEIKPEAGFIPTPGTPGILSTVSPTRACTSITLSGVTPNFSFTLSIS